jgi:ubiquinone/menaquinone biosynthesis C-methylase UbiE
VQSVEIANIDQYYDSDYDILVESEEEDQIYEVVNGTAVYRTEHQVATLLDKVGFSSGTKILDYGCAKSSTMRALISKNPGVQVHLFDVSDRYIPFWKRFLSEDRWATYAIPPVWDGKFDVVTSFFSLEHMARPQEALQQISRVLQSKGTFYGIVPNVFTNTADMIVVDHVNHFTRVSLGHLLSRNGFQVVEIDDKSHRGALVFKAEKVANTADAAPEPGKIQSAFEEASKIARYWQSIGIKIKDFERSIQDVDRFAVYGAGFYGAFIASCLQHPERISCVIDQNTFLHGRKVNGVDVVPPAGLPENTNVILVGLNPAHAKRLIEEIPDFRSRQLTYFFL